MNNNYVLVKIEGKNVSNYVKWLIKNKINIINLNVIKPSELNVIIDYKDYSLLTKYSKTYKITILKKYGRLRIFDIIKSNIIIIVCLTLSIFFLYFLSNPYKIKQFNKKLLLVSSNNWNRFLLKKLILFIKLFSISK